MRGRKKSGEVIREVEAEERELFEHEFEALRAEMFKMQGYLRDIVRILKNIREEIGEWHVEKRGR